MWVGEEVLSTIFTVGLTDYLRMAWRKSVKGIDSTTFMSYCHWKWLAPKEYELFLPLVAVWWNPDTVVAFNTIFR